MTGYRSGKDAEERRAGGGFEAESRPAGTGPAGGAADRLPPEERRELGAALDALAGWTRSASDRPESFWEQQRAAVWRRLAARRRTTRRLGMLAAAVCAVVIALAVAGVNHHSQEAPLRAQTEQDRELLLRVEQTMQSDGPEALAPAALLVQKVSTEADANSIEGESSPGER